MTHTLPVRRLPVRRLLATVAIAVTIPLATACGSSSTPPSTNPGTSASSAISTTSAASTTRSTVAEGDAAYCEVLTSGQKELESMSDKISDKAALEQGKVVLEKIEAAAPAEVKAAWGDFIAFVDAAASGDKKAVAASTQKMDAAGTEIEKHAKATCGFDIS